MQNTDLNKDIQFFANCGPIRVWSLVITILGDLCQKPEDFITGRALGHLVARLGVNNQALRVALHRLRRDGWIRTERDGRSSNYYLSNQGQTMVVSVRNRIYQSNPPKKIPIYLIVAPPSVSATDFANTLPESACNLSTRIALFSGDTTLPPNYLQIPLEANPVPDWITEIIAPSALQSEFCILQKAIRTVLSEQVPTTIVDRTILRLIILHHWRRLILRQSLLADILLPDQWPGAMARRQVSVALTRYDRPDLLALNACLDDRT
ncbi:PaaX family transcriptional regulator C-terminal domain-containing protein [Pseudopelagicola sp. nBUS_20]|uniref:PaaX family transcriptional regulator C-terminal domain-containing protein n=1 Tax=Pseudopelagicola sp. nBUS_20 TaxID=3395317 RepID=UPI003EB8E083